MSRTEQERVSSAATGCRTSPRTDRLSELFKQPIRVVALGIPTFAEELRKQGVSTTEIDWKPPAGGNEKVLAFLDRIRRHCTI
jgi:hypothetical protein